MWYFQIMHFFYFIELVIQNVLKLFLRIEYLGFAINIEQTISNLEDSFDEMLMESGQDGISFLVCQKYARGKNACLYRFSTPAI